MSTTGQPATAMTRRCAAILNDFEFQNLFFEGRGKCPIFLSISSSLYFLDNSRQYNNQKIQNVISYK